MVVDDEYSGHDGTDPERGRGWVGNMASIRTPGPAPAMDSEPPSSMARSRIVARPLPAGVPAAMPTPLSITDTASAASLRVSETQHRVACACRTMLVTASRTMRYAATSTAAGKPVRFAEACTMASRQRRRPGERRPVGRHRPVRARQAPAAAIPRRRDARRQPSRGFGR